MIDARKEAENMAEWILDDIESGLTSRDAFLTEHDSEKIRMILINDTLLPVLEREERRSDEAWD